MSKEVSKSSKEKILPNEKINLGNQIDILKAITVFWNKNKRAVSHKEIAPLVGLTPPNVSRCLKFWKNTGLIKEASRGLYLPTDSLISFNFGASNDTNLPSVIGETWFGSVVVMTLNLKDTMSESEIKETIAAEYSVSNDHKPSDRSLSYALEILVRSGVVKRTNDTFTANKVNSDTKSSQPVSTIHIDEDKDFIQVVLGNDRFAVNREDLVAFIRQKGRSLGDEARIE